MTTTDVNHYYYSTASIYVYCSKYLCTVDLEGVEPGPSAPELFFLSVYGTWKNPKPTQKRVCSCMLHLWWVSSLSANHLILYSNKTRGLAWLNFMLNNISGAVIAHIQRYSSPLKRVLNMKLYLKCIAKRNHFGIFMLTISYCYYLYVANLDVIM